MTLFSKIAFAVLMAVTAATNGLAQDNNASVSIPADGVGFAPAGVKTEAGELYAGPAYGNLQAGKHATFIRMPARFVSPLHSHTEDYYAVVVAGIGVNTQVGKPDIKLPVGSYWFQKGGEPHVTKCVSNTECLFFLSQPGKFDYVPTK